MRKKKNKKKKTNNKQKLGEDVAIKYLFPVNFRQNLFSGCRGVKLYQPIKDKMAIFIEVSTRKQQHKNLVENVE